MGESGQAMIRLESWFWPGRNALLPESEFYGLSGTMRLHGREPRQSDRNIKRGWLQPFFPDVVLLPSITSGIDRSDWWGFLPFFILFGLIIDELPQSEDYGPPWMKQVQSRESWKPHGGGRSGSHRSTLSQAIIELSEKCSWNAQNAHKMFIEI